MSERRASKTLQMHKQNLQICVGMENKKPINCDGIKIISEVATNGWTDNVREVRLSWRWQGDSTDFEIV